MQIRRNARIAVRGPGVELLSATRSPSIERSRKRAETYASNTRGTTIRSAPSSRILRIVRRGRTATPASFASQFVPVRGAVTTSADSIESAYEKTGQLLRKMIEARRYRTEPKTGRAEIVSAPLGDIEEIDHSGVQRVFSANHQEPGVLNQSLEDFRSMAQMVHGSSDGGPHGLTHQDFRIVSQLGSQQRLDGWSNAIHNRTQALRLVV